jgi:proline iminopeptidase
LRQLYPPLAAHTSVQLDVGDGHRLYVERCGTVGALPVVFLHGGPGSGCKADHRQFFAPQSYDVVLFDQRGSGRSVPYGGVEHNDTAALVADMERIREYFGIAQWVVFGGSWGATLALAYAEAHPERVLGMVLRGSFLARRRDMGWFAGDGANRLLPMQWQRFVENVGVTIDEDLISHLHHAVFSADKAIIERVARAWDAWSTAVVMFSLESGGDAGASELASAIAKCRIEMHYAAHHYFLDDNQLLRDAHRLPRVPTTIIHGARDLTCTAEAGWSLHRAISGSRLEILRTAGHLSSEAPMVDALVRAADEMAVALSGARITTV